MNRVALSLCALPAIVVSFLLTEYAQSIVMDAKLGIGIQMVNAVNIQDSIVKLEKHV